MGRRADSASLNKEMIHRSILIDLRVLFVILLCACFISVHCTDEQEKWLKWYRMRLDELKVHEARGQLDVEEGFSSFHIKVSLSYCCWC